MLLFILECWFIIIVLVRIWYLGFLFWGGGRWFGCFNIVFVDSVLERYAISRESWGHRREREREIPYWDLGGRWTYQKRKRGVLFWFLLDWVCFSHLGFPWVKQDPVRFSPSPVNPAQWPFICLHLKPFFGPSSLLGDTPHFLALFCLFFA